MPRKRFKTEEIIQKLREVEVLLSIRNATCVEQLRDLRVFLPRFTNFDGDEASQVKKHGTRNVSWLCFGKTAAEARLPG